MSLLSFKLSAFVCDREVLSLAAPVFVVDADNFERVNHLRRQLKKNNFHCQEDARQLDILPEH